MTHAIFSKPVLHYNTKPQTCQVRIWKSAKNCSAIIYVKPKEMKKVKKSIEKLKPYPKNEEIYGSNEPIADLVEQIRQRGIVTTLTINEDDVILSGNRRWKACNQLLKEGDSRFSEVDCEVRCFESEEDELEYLILCNYTREKTMEQKAREAQMLLEVERIRAEKRKLAGLKQNHDENTDMAESPQREDVGTSRDIVAEKLQMKSGREVDRVVKSVKKIDELKMQGREKDSEVIRNVLNKNSASTAESLAANIDKISNEDKQAILEGRKSANRVVDEITGKAAKRKAKSQEKQLGSLENPIILSTKEIIADLHDTERDRSCTSIQIALMIESNVKTLVGAFDMIRHEKHYNDKMDDESREICEKSLNQLKGLVKLLENKINGGI